MKKILSITLVLLLAFSLFAAGTKEQATSKTIVVGATPEPHAAFLNLIVEDLAAEGYTLKVQEFTDYVTPNEALESGELDANFFQHIPYLESFNKEKGYHLANAAASTSSRSHSIPRNTRHSQTFQRCHHRHSQ
jgi:D-methionine transport system substrate-binding protein